MCSPCADTWVWFWFCCGDCQARGCCSIRTTPTSCSCAGSWRSSSRLPNFSTPLSSRAAASWVSSCSTSRLAQLRQQRRHRHCQHQLPMPSRPAIL
ncbi:hypothetical protein ZEAMMB73_Zm00001d027240 [Zea mays]|uniref:Secreted protein n=1 Tax=Zea mays TaxID=4577 RepID=A0A1D6JJ89_MAIZE|nr:hypothetical protein ZEAMMB73_Zm00001d027240 [Zea mays]ONL92410.1 hypothetical protein ZEAMMB73_Zm00001d027240 [Zea mays]ONL92417.1 hypothetical protein ZEAMMB73_Zm00001d027240 [Zea mays]ONL92419.1 hypothetical protein ZEAMMB73_Zm00001d027240 [Zea mays]